MVTYDNAKRKKWGVAGYPTNLGSAAAALPPPTKFMRVYHMLKTEHARTSIEHGWMKVSRFGDLNDPFELMALRVMDGSVRRAVTENRRAEDSQSSLLCFSEDWTSPVMWSHYADRHEGICLGFNVDRSLLKKVDYFNQRLRVAMHTNPDPFVLSAELQEALRNTKCHEWQYEREQRVIVKLTDTIESGGLRYRRMGADMQLAEVIVGPKCKEPTAELRELVSKHWPNAVTFEARLAWKHFKVVPRESSVP